MAAIFAPPFLLPTHSSPIYRLLKELPLVLVSSILLWAQYTLSVSLVLVYLVADRRLYGLAIAIWIPFQIFWASTVANLAACILTGPGWVQSPSQLALEGADKFERRLEEQLPGPHSYELGQLQHDPRPPSRPGRRHHPVRTDYEEPEDEEMASDEHEEGGIPLLAAHSYASPMRSPAGNVLMPRSPAPGPLPPYLARPAPLPPSSLSFQEQVQRQQRRAPPEPTLLATLGLGDQTGGGEESGQMDTLMCKSDGSRRFCRKCALFKADRSHHCSSCGRCVLRMDHHCPWLGGRCVGLHNHKHFLLFLVSGSLTALIAALAAIKGLSDFVSISHLSGDGFQLAPLNWAFLVLVGTLFGMVLSGFTAYHLYLVSVNRTTIENMERSLRVRPTPNADASTSYALLRSNGRTLPAPAGPPDGLPSYHLPIYKSDDRLTRAERRLLEAGSAKLNVYDLGSRAANYREIFGTESPWWEWLLPVRPKGISDGYTYKINEEHLDKLRELTAEVRLLPSERAGELRFERP